MNNDLVNLTSVVREKACYYGNLEIPYGVCTVSKQLEEGRYLLFLNYPKATSNTSFFFFGYINTNNFYANQLIAFHNTLAANDLVLTYNPDTLTITAEKKSSAMPFGTCLYIEKL